MDVQKRKPARLPPKLKKESLRLLGADDLNQVAGGNKCARGASRYCISGDGY